MRKKLHEIPCWRQYSERRFPLMMNIKHFGHVTKRYIWQKPNSAHQLENTITAEDFRWGRDSMPNRTMMLNKATPEEIRTRSLNVLERPSKNTDLNLSENLYPCLIFAYYQWYPSSLTQQFNKKERREMSGSRWEKLIYPKMTYPKKIWSCNCSTVGVPPRRVNRQQHMFLGLYILCVSR